MNCDSKRHGADEPPPAVKEWFDPFDGRAGRWRPVCASCVDVLTRTYEAQRRRLDPVAQIGFDSIVHFRDL